MKQVISQEEDELLTAVHYTTINFRTFDNTIWVGSDKGSILAYDEAGELVYKQEDIHEGEIDEIIWINDESLFIGANK